MSSPMDDDIQPRIPTLTSTSLSPWARVVGIPRHDTYMALPEPVKMHVTRSEWDWMSDRAKRALIGDLCRPDWSE